MPTGETLLEGAGELRGEVIRGLAFWCNALVVRRVADEPGRLSGRQGGGVHRGNGRDRVARLRGNCAVHPGAAGVVQRHAHIRRVDVGGEKLARRQRAHRLPGLLAHRVPGVHVEALQRLEAEAAIEPRRAVGRHLRGLDDQRARAAQRVEQHVARRPARELEQAGGQVLFQRRRAVLAAPAALEQRLAAGVEVEQGVGLAQMQVDAHIRVRGVHVRALARQRAKSVADAVFHPQRGELDARKRAALGGHVHAQRLGHVEPFFPSQIAGQVIDVFGVGIAATAAQQQHPAGQAAVQVQPHRIRQAALHGQATGRRHTRSQGGAVLG